MRAALRATPPSTSGKRIATISNLRPRDAAQDSPENGAMIPSEPWAAKRAEASAVKANPNAHPNNAVAPMTASKRLTIAHNLDWLIYSPGLFMLDFLTSHRHQLP